MIPRIALSDGDDALLLVTVLSDKLTAINVELSKLDSSEYLKNRWNYLNRQFDRTLALHDAALDEFRRCCAEERAALDAELVRDPDADSGVSGFEHDRI